MQTYYFPPLCAGNWLHADQFSTFWYILPDFLTFPHPAPSAPFSWPSNRNLEYLEHPHQVCVELLNWMNGCMQYDSCYWYKLALCIVWSISDSYNITESNFVFKCVLAIWLDRNRQDDIKFIGCQSTRLGVYIFLMARTILAHVQMYHAVSQFDHWNQEKADKKHNSTTNCFLKGYVVKFRNCNAGGSTPRYT